MHWFRRGVYLQKASHLGAGATAVQQMIEVDSKMSQVVGESVWLQHAISGRTLEFKLQWNVAFRAASFHPLPAAMVENLRAYSVT